MYTREYMEWMLSAVLVGGGPLFFAFYAYRELVVSLAKDLTPAALFQAALFGSVPWAGITGLAIWVVIQSRELSVIWLFLFIFMCLMVAFGWVGWLAELSFGGLLSAKYGRFLASHPVPKFQIWLSDALTGAFATGVTMLMHLSRARSTGDMGNDVNNEPPVALLLAYIFISQAGGFAMALDACRRGGERVKRVVPRMIYVLTVMVFCGVPPLFVLAVPAWWAWRWALWKGRVG